MARTVFIPTMVHLPSMRALVTGANGFLGAWLTRRLLAGGHLVRALLRPGSVPGGLSGLAIEEARGDVTEPA
ncbi:MAG: hypothetical protein NTY18_02900, partial [Deltaproteobacteria bacterium]|nr:hypothetical protein [Deltaproteobacteria bacterium]